MRQNEAEILAKTYRDRMTVKRSVPEMDPETLESRMALKTVYEEEPCALSQKANNRPERQEAHSEASMEAVIFSRPGIFLEDNDVVELVTEAGQQLRGKSGKTFGYVSHGETTFYVDKLA